MSYLHTEHGALILAHRGFSRDGLENSMAAFGAARALGLRHVETDAHATADGVAVALHDERLDRTTDATGAVGDLPWSAVRRARIGGREQVPLLADVLGTWPDLCVNIDVKTAAAIPAVAHAIEATASWDRVCVTSFSTARRRRTVALLSRPVTTSAGTAEMVAFLLAGRARRALRRVDALQVPERFGAVRVVDARTVGAAHAAGRQVHVWTVNDPADMHRLLDLGVDGLVTDRSDLARAVLVERGLWHGTI